MSTLSTFDGQTMAALLCVMLAIAAMGRWSVRWWRGQSIGGCGACPSGCGEASQPEPIRLKLNLPIIDVSDRD